MPTGHENADDRTVPGTRLHVSVKNGKIVVDSNVGDAPGDSKYFLLLEGDDVSSSDGLAVAAEIIKHLENCRPTHSRTRQWRNYRHKHRRRRQPQEHTFLRIIPIRESPSGMTSDEARKGKAAATDAFSRADEQQLEFLAAELNEAARRMDKHLDRAIRAIRKSLAPEHETKWRKRYEAEFAGKGDSLQPGFG